MLLIKYFACAWTSVISGIFKIFEFKLTGQQIATITNFNGTN